MAAVCRPGIQSGDSPPTWVTHSLISLPPWAQEGRDNWLQPATPHPVGAENAIRDPCNLGTLANQPPAWHSPLPGPPRLGSSTVALIGFVAPPRCKTIWWGMKKKKKTSVNKAWLSWHIWRLGDAFVGTTPPHKWVHPRSNSSRLALRSPING